MWYSGRMKKSINKSSDWFSRILLFTVALSIVAALGAFTYSTINKQIILNGQERERLEKIEAEKAAKENAKKDQERKEALVDCEYRLGVIVPEEETQITGDLYKDLKASLEAKRIADEQTQQRREMMKDQIDACMTEKGY